MRLELLREKALEEGDFSFYVNRVKNDLQTKARMIAHSAGIEGNTFDTADTYTVIANAEDLSETITDRYPRNEIAEIVDLKQAVDYMYDCVEEGADLDEEFILELHALAVGSDLNSNPGEFKENPNYTMYKGVRKDYVDPQEVEKSIISMCDTYNNSERELRDISEAMVKFINIHPFRDGNGRVHRLLINWLLLTNNFPPIIIQVSEKDEYIEALHYEDYEAFEEFLELKLRDAYSEMLEESSVF